MEVTGQTPAKYSIYGNEISKYRKVYRNELVVGFPIDEGVLGFQTKYDFAAVSPAYSVWKLKKKDINVHFIELLLRSNSMREVYKSKMQGSVDRRRSIPKDIFLEIFLPIPSLETQNEIVQKYQKIEDARMIMMHKH